MRWLRRTLECSFEDNLLIYWSDLKLRPEVVASATNLVQEANLWLPLPQHLLFQRKSQLMHQLIGGTLKWFLWMIHSVWAILFCMPLRLLGVLDLKLLVLVQMWLTWWSYIWTFPTTKAKLHLALVAFGNMELSVLGTEQVCDFCN